MNEINFINEEILRTDLRLAIPLSEFVQAGKFRNIHMNPLTNSGFAYSGEVITCVEAKILKIPNFGRKGMNDLHSALDELGLRVGTPFDETLPKRDIWGILNCLVIDHEYACSILDANKEDAIRQYRAGAFTQFANVSVVQPILATEDQFRIVINKGLEELRTKAFGLAGKLITEAAERVTLASTEIYQDQSSNAYANPILNELAQAIADSHKAILQDAAACVRELGDRFSDPRFRKILVDAFERHDRVRGNKPGGTEP